MKKGNINEVSGSKGSGRYKVPLTLAPQDWKMDSMGPFTEPVSHYINPDNAYDSYDGKMKKSKKEISKDEKIAKMKRKIADNNFQQNDADGNPMNGYNPKGVSEPGTPDYIKKQAHLPKKDYEEILKEDLAVWFGTKKKPKGSKQPKGPWVNICRKDKNGKHPPCGRPEAKDSSYPKCRAAGVAGKMSDSEKRSACTQKRKAEKTHSKVGTGNKPRMVSYKPKNEGLKDIIKKVLRESI